MKTSTAVVLALGIIALVVGICVAVYGYVTWNTGTTSFDKAAYLWSVVGGVIVAIVGAIGTGYGALTARTKPTMMPAAPTTPT